MQLHRIHVVLYLPASGCPEGSTEDFQLVDTLIENRGAGAPRLRPVRGLKHGERLCVYGSIRKQDQERRLTASGLASRRGPLPRGPLDRFPTRALESRLQGSSADASWRKDLPRSDRPKLLVRVFGVGATLLLAILVVFVLVRLGSLAGTGARALASAWLWRARALNGRGTRGR